MKTLKFIFLQLVFGCMLSGQLYSQEKTIKLSIMYTADVASSVNNIKQQIENQTNIINTILQNSGIIDITLEVSYNKITKYKEPKHRTNGYIRFSHDGTYQILDEVSNHAKLMDYFIDNNVSTFDENVIDYIDKSELSQSLISINGSTKNNVVLFIVDEDGPPIISEYFPEDITNRSSRTFFSIINYETFSNLDISLALGFFGIFTNETNAELDEDNVPVNSSLMSFWKFDDANVKKELSTDNKVLFLCNLSKLELKAPIKLELGGVLVENETKNSVIEGDNSIVIMPSSNANKRPFSVIAPAGDDYSMSMVTKRTRFNYPICNVITERSANTDASEFITEATERKAPVTNNEEELITNISIPYPNPTNGDVTFNVTLAESGFYKLALYDIITGQQVRVLFDKKMPKGVHEIRGNVSGLKSTIYIYRLESELNLPISGRLIVK
ncbi:hypothetical protein KORDIASMS9_02911 [Kordia sp. SMS9]|uniref:T9SS type A sorting domain-containing protein n=1 Tax=Kordia sp. SMS9 TaxID=2282170 RepID=UPI000E0D28DC|nr:T9SS type A sorting domain-containing protein [Kordia sp. SMS9]AXG70667.1 hypothetical protein KORDIASMS9_02911 [Kordia sp. SMS9]